jgi:hypothetical protein
MIQAKRLLLAIAFTVSATWCIAQDTTKVQNVFWTPRFGVGLQQAVYIEAGVTKLFEEKNFSSSAIYAAAEMNFRHRDVPAYGLKIGFETSWALGMWALELKALSVSSLTYAVLTPKIGVSLFGNCNLLYGYNLQHEDIETFGIARNQVSLIFNINKALLRESKKK